MRLSLRVPCWVVSQRASVLDVFPCAKATFPFGCGSQLRRALSWMLRWFHGSMLGWSNAGWTVGWMVAWLGGSANLASSGSVFPDGMHPHATCSAGFNSLTLLGPGGGSALDRFLGSVKVVQGSGLAAGR